MSTDFEIEPNIPIPEKGAGGTSQRAKYPWTEMSVGDSFFVDVTDLPGEDRWRRVQSVQEYASRAGKKHDRTFSTRRIKSDDGRLLGMRVWRTQ